MGKVKVADLARKIGMAETDLRSKLRSIGVRPEGEEGLLDVEVLKAIFEGKRLATPREVIERADDKASRAAQAAAAELPTPEPTVKQKNASYSSKESTFVCFFVIRRLISLPSAISISGYSMTASIHGLTKKSSFRVRTGDLRSSGFFAESGL